MAGPVPAKVRENLLYHKEEAVGMKRGHVLLVGLGVMFSICVLLSIYLILSHSVLYATICVVLAMLNFGGIAFLSQY